MNGTDVKEKVVAEIVTPEEAQIQEEATNVERLAAEIVVNSEETLQGAVDFVKLIKESGAKVTSFFKPMKDSAYKAHKSICDREKEMLKPLNEAEKQVKQKIGAYTMEQERKRKELEEQMRRQAEAEAERKMAEAIEHEAQGNTQEAEAALMDAQFTEQAAKNVGVNMVAPKADGMSTSKAWEITGIDSSKVPVEINGMEIRPVDEKAVMRLIKASKGKIVIPGISYKETVSVSVRR